MIYKTFITSAVFLLISTLAFTQDCPANRTQLALTNTWDGPVCADLDVSGGVTITGNAIWNADAMNLYNGSGGTANITINSGGSLTINSGTISLSGRIIINAGGTITVASGASLVANGTGDNQIFGTLNSSGTVSVNGDLAVSAATGGAGTVNITGGTFNVGNPANPHNDNDLQVFGGGHFNVSSGASVYVEADMETRDDTTPGEGHFNIQGSVHVDGNVTIYNTTPNSHLLGGPAGVIDVDGSFSDAECSTYTTGIYAYCSSACNGSNVTCGSTLPVVLKDFSGEQENNIILIEWTTASEIDNDYFTLERLTKDDAFEEVLKVNGHGTTKVMQHYSAYDLKPSPGPNYYRLKQTDFDGKTSYSSLIRIDFASKDFSLNIFPNPAEKDFSTIEVLNTTPLRDHFVEIRNAHGVLVRKLSVTSDETGFISHNLLLDDFSPGLYFISTLHHTIKFVVE